jgi:hypothetical protein
MFELKFSLSSYVCIRIKRSSDSVSEIHCHFAKDLRRVASSP